MTLGACEQPEEDHSTQPQRQALAERLLESELNRIEGYADGVYQALRPVPLLTTAERSALRRYLNPQHLTQARALGVPRPNQAQIEGLVESGELVRLADSSEYWAIRELGYSVPLVTPDVQAMLDEIGERFHDRLEELGVPQFRFVISSLLRTRENQEALRQTNPNAAIGVSTHEFGTTIDIAYGSYAAPHEPVIEIEAGEAPWLEPYLRRIAAAMLERTAARKSRELMAILGHVLREMQAEGKVMVTLEQRQPVYHMTVAQRY